MAPLSPELWASLMVGRPANIGQNHLPSEFHSPFPPVQELAVVGTMVGVGFQKILILAEVDVLGVLPSYCEC